MSGFERKLMVLALSAAMVAGFAAEGRAASWVSTSGVSATSGDYGTGQDTTVTQLYETAKLEGEKGELGLMVPYLFRRGSGVTPGESGRARNRAIPEDADGFGDVQLLGKLFWLEETGSRPAVDWGGRVKFPTASEEDGLGTGRFDFGVGPEVLKHFGSLMTFADLELVLRDKPDDSTLKPVRLDYSIGTGYPFTEKLTGYISLDGGTPTNSGADAPLEVVLSAVCKATEAVRIGGFVLAGLTDGSPDIGGGAEVSIHF